MNNAETADNTSASSREQKLAKMLLETVHGHAAIKGVVQGQKNSRYLNDLLLLVSQVDGGPEMIAEKKRAHAKYVIEQTNPRRVARGQEPIKIVNVEAA